MNANVQFIRRSAEVRFARLADWLVDVPANRVARGDVEIRLTPKAMAVLRELIGRAGTVVRRDDLLGIVWRDGFPTDDVLTHAITELRRALEDDPKQPKLIETIPKVGYRLLGAVEVTDDVGDGAVPTEPPTPSLPESPPERPWLLLSALAVLIVMTLVFPLFRGVVESAAPAPFSADSRAREELVRPQALTADPTRDEFPSLSPDGGTVAYVATADEPELHSQIYLKSLDPAAVPVPLFGDAEGNDTYPVWSPDGKQIAYLHMAETRCDIRVAPALGGQSRSIGECSNVNIDYIDWTADGRSLLVAKRDLTADAGTPHAVIVRLALDTGKAQRLDYRPLPRGQDDLQPRQSPDGKWIAFRRGAIPYSDLYLVPDAGGEVRRLTSLRSRIRGFAWLPDSSGIVFSSDHAGGQQLFRLGVNDGVVVALGGDDAEFPTVARRAKVMAWQQTRGLTHLAEFALNANGDLRDPRYIAPSTRSDWYPSLSPSGRFVAFVSNRTGGTQLWIHDYRQQSTFPVTRLDHIHISLPQWSPDERAVLFIARSAGRSELMMTEIDTGRLETLSARNERVRFGSFSHDGKWIYFSGDRSGDWQVWRMRRTRAEAEQLTRAGGFDPRDFRDPAGIYYTKETTRGLWRLDLATRQEKRVSWYAGYFNMDAITVRDGQLYYVDAFEVNGRARVLRTPLSLAGTADPMTENYERLGTFAEPGLLSDATFAPDLMRVVVTQMRRDDTDLMTATLGTPAPAR
jgi:Tol biopolymer transport system component/DNA-binding winged helix-turn-helix (wHTH) protein